MILKNSRDLVASWLALARWRKRRKWSHLTDRPCYYCYFGSPVMWDGLRCHWSPTRLPSSLTRAAPDRHRRLTGLGDGNLADGWVRAGGGGRCEDPGCSSAPTLLPNENKTGTKTITARLGPARSVRGDLAPQPWTVSPRAGSRYARGSGPPVVKVFLS